MGFAYILINLYLIKVILRTTLGVEVKLTLKVWLTVKVEGDFDRENIGLCYPK